MRWLERLLPRALAEERGRKAAEALRDAASRGDVDAARRLMAKGSHPCWRALGMVGAADPRAQALSIGVKWSGSAALVEALLVAGAADGLRMAAGWDAIELAARRQEESALAAFGPWALARAAKGEIEGPRQQWAALHAVVARGDCAGARELVGSGIDPDILPNRGWDGSAASFRAGPALVEAARRGDAAMVRALLRAGADPNQAHAGGTTALMLAACRRKHWGSAPHWQRPQQPGPGQAKLIEALIEGGARVEARNHEGDTALGLALRDGARPEVMDALIAAGATFERVGREVFLDALEAGGNLLNRSDCEGGTLCLVASEQPWWAGPGPGPAGQSPQAAAWAIAQRKSAGRRLLFAATVGDAPAALALLDAGGSAEQSNDEGETLLMLAASAGCGELVEDLLARRVAVNRVGPGGASALHRAAARDRPEAALALLGAGAAPDAVDRRGRTPLMEAARSGRSELVEALIGRGVALDRVNAQGESALMLAASEGRLEAVRLLAEADADPELRDALGRSALDRARHAHENAPAIIAALESKALAREIAKAIDGGTDQSPAPARRRGRL